MKIFSTLFLLCSFLVSTSNAQISIRDAREANPDGTLMLDGDEVTVSGIAIGPNFRPGGQTFALVDTSDNIGITIFSTNEDFGYSVTDGDELEVTGTLAQFNGLAEIVPTTINILSQGNAIPQPSEVQVLDEFSESNLVVIRDVMLVDENDWELSGSFNVDVTDGTQTFQLRIDSDTDISGMDAPTGTFDVTGIGGQFDNESPFDAGYQLFPRNASDISPYNTGEIEYTRLTMREARETDGDGVLIRDGDRVELTGVVHGINLRPSGLQFWIIDNANTGIVVFSLNDQFGYTVNEGDELTIQGILSDFNGLAQITPEIDIQITSTENELNAPAEVDMFSEDTESSWLTINVIDYVDMSEWMGDGSSFNVDFVNIIGDTMRVRIDNDSPLSTAPAPALPALVTGVGSQFDSSSPFTSGYQLLPMSETAFATYLSTKELYDGFISVTPNPVSDMLNITAEDRFNTVKLFDMQGREVMRNGGDKILSVRDITDGIYLLIIEFEESVWHQKLVVKH